MKLFNYFRSSASWRVRIGLAFKGVAYEYVSVHLGKGEQNEAEYMKVNPSRTVPLLELDDGRRLSQSIAILEYLEERHPTPPLLPKDPYLRAKSRQLAELVNSGIQPFQNLATLQYLKAQQLEEKGWAAYWIARGLAALETEVAQLGGAFCVGDAPGFPDVCLVPQLHGARRFSVDLAAYPRLVAIEARCVQLPAFQAAAPERQPDFQA